MNNLPDQQDSPTSSTQPKEEILQDIKCPICQEKATKTCAACKSVAYCSVEHQKLHWKNHKKSCQAFTIEKTEGMGVGWVAMRDLQAGFILMDGRPYFQAACWPRVCSNNLRRCVTCGAYSRFKSLSMCSKCSWPVCNQKCDENPVHSENECKEFTSRKLKYPPRSKWPVGMLLIGMRANAIKFRDPRKFKLLMANKNTFIPATLKMEHKIAIPQKLLDLFSGPNSLDREELEKLWRICIDDDSGPLQGFSTRCIWLEACRNNLSCYPNHSCFPNITIVNYGSLSNLKQRIRIVIPVTSGEQLTSNYYDEDDFAIQSTAFRQRHTRDKVGFTCMCKRCLDPTELGLFISGIKCFNCSIGLKADSDSDADNIGFLVPADPLDIDSSDPEFECHRCHFKAPFSKVMETLPKTVQAAFQSIGRWNDGASYLVSSLENILIQIEESRDFKDHLHRNHWIIQFAVRLVVNSQINCLDEMTKQELDKLVERLEWVHTLDKTLYPGLLFQKRYENLGRLNKAASLRSTKFGKGMCQERREKLYEISEKAEKEQLEYLSHEPCSGLEDGGERVNCYKANNMLDSL